MSKPVTAVADSLRNSSPHTSELPKGQVIATVVLCWLFIVFDGYDLIVYGTIISSLVEEWGISPSTAGNIGSTAFFGMIFGALVAGPLSDRLGRKSVTLSCVTIFSVFTALCGLAGGPMMFAIFRLIAGIGLGGIVVAANALASDIVSDRIRPVVATVLMSGVPIGGCIAALVGIPTIPSLGWQAMLFFAIIPFIVLVPIGLKVLPNIPIYKAPVTETGPESEPLNKPGGIGALFHRPYTGMSILFPFLVGSIFVAWYGLGTWLPNLMEESGYNLGSALFFTLALNLGAVGGSFFTAWSGKQFGTLTTGMVAVLIAGVSLIIMGSGPPTFLIYVCLALAGIGTHGSACLVTATVAMSYPRHLRGSGLGWGFGIGRIGAVLAPISAGWILAMGFPPSANFYWFAIMALVASALFFAVWILQKKIQRSAESPVPTTMNEQNSHVS